MTAQIDLPPWSSESCVNAEWTLHQIAPYIGRLKSTIANHLIAKYTKCGDLVVDPFCGSGTIPVEAAYNGRSVAAYDWNPYAALLTSAKLTAPRTNDEALSDVADVWNLATTKHSKQDLRKVPKWVRQFFHPRTLKEALSFRDASVELKNTFALSCLLGILHHQRPGFLSYPSSHLVPYLRTRSFPRDTFPEMYEYRAIYPRLVAKVARVYKRFPSNAPENNLVQCATAQESKSPKNISAVITSPPYMNELDYVRDNRLRIWFINRDLEVDKEIRSGNREEGFRALMTQTVSHFAPKICHGGHIILVVGDVSRGGRRLETLDIVKKLMSEEENASVFSLVAEIDDYVPDIRRSRRELRGTKKETTVVYRKN